MKKFEIIIKDRETGETIINAKTDCIIGAYENKDNTEGISVVNSNIPIIINTIIETKKIIKKIIREVEEDNCVLGKLAKLMTAEYGEDDDE